MKAKLIFDLDDPDDAGRHLRAIKAPDMAIVLFEMVANVKRKIEHKIDNQDLQTPQETLDEIFLEFNALMSEQNLNIDELN